MGPSNMGNGWDAYLPMSMAGGVLPRIKCMRRVHSVAYGIHYCPARFQGKGVDSMRRFGTLHYDLHYSSFITEE
jgi:hypothetical protein